MKTKTGKKLLSLLLVGVMLLGLMPTVGAVESDEPTSPQIITAFEDLADGVVTQEVALRTAKDELSLPATLTATVDSTPTAIDVTWASADYDRETAATYVFTAQISGDYQLDDGVVLPTITITVTAAEAEPQAQTVTITVENETSALYLAEGVTVTEDDLLAGVSAADEQGNPVVVTLSDLGGLDLSDPQYQAAPYTLTYSAAHPESGETFTATREVYVIGIALRTSDPTSYIFDISEGDITIESSGSNNLKVTYGGIPTTTSDFSNTTQITIIGTSTSAANNKVTVQDGVTAKITLKGVDITNDVSPFQLGDNTVVELTLSGSNKLTCTYSSSASGSLGIYAGLYVSPSAAITIAAETDDSDSLTTNGGVHGAGIGGSYISSISGDNDAGSITINSGTIIAEGGNGGAGIGGGDDGAGGTVNISGGKITATGGFWGAGIGGGWYGDGGTVTISGGTITAKGGYYGAGIGGGYYGTGGTIEISGGTIIAEGGNEGAGIGGGYNGDGGTIKISGGTIIATGGNSATNDIGYGFSGSGISNSIEITGGSVNATNVNPQPTNDGSSTQVYLNTLTVGSAANANTAITAASVSGLTTYTYGIKDVKTDENGKVYFWLPMTGNNGTEAEAISVAANNNKYAAIYERGNAQNTKTLTELTTLTKQSIAGGDIVITQYNDYYTVTVGGILMTMNEYSQVFTITGSSGSNIVTVSAGNFFNSGSAVQITLQGVTISNAVSPFQLLGTAEVELTLSGSNTLTCISPSSSSFGIYAGLYVSPTAKITIAAATDDATDSLTATGGSYGAGIGGSYVSSTSANNAAGSITINSGTIEAQGGILGAGIGGGSMGDGGTITIFGGTITANGGGDPGSGAGIGGGYLGAGGTITITGGTITAQGGNWGAGIGGGYNGDGGTIEISGGTITANGGDWGAGIGGGYLRDGGTISISGETIKATGGDRGAGIGGGGGGAGGTIEISGGTIKATGGDYGAAGIGGGYYGDGGDLNISGGTIITTKGSYAQNDIGNGSNGSAGSIVITGGSVKPTNGTDAVSPQPINDGSTHVYLNTLTVGSSPVAITAITAGSVDGVSMDIDPDALNGYGINDVKTDTDGSVYFWLTAADSSNLVTVADDSATYGAYFARSNNTAQILYTPFTVSFETGGGSSVADQSIYYGGKVSVASTTKNGYSFAGWYSDSGCNTAWDFDTDTVTNNMILYAAWEENDDPSTTYTITFDANGGSVTSETMETGTDGKLSTLPTPTRSGYSFTGWYTQAKDGAQITTDTVFTENTTVYAQWTYNGSNRSSSSSSSTSYYTLSFEENGGSVIASISRASDTRIDLSEYKPTRDGYTFAGWYSDSTLTTKVTSVTLTKNTTVYAGWELKEEKNGIIHAPYISGYTDGTFRPDSSITRAETAQLLYNISGKTATGSNKFSDVSSDKWYYNAVTSLTNSGVISGYTDGTFKPVNSITRAEFVALVVRYAGKTEASRSSFSDVSSDHWASGYIAAATKAGYISGYTDGSFRPDAAITRAEAVTVLNAMVGREIEKDALSSLTMPFSDVPTSHWAYDQILEASVEHAHSEK